MRELVHEKYLSTNEDLLKCQNSNKRRIIEKFPKNNTETQNPMSVKPLPQQFLREESNQFTSYYLDNMHSAQRTPTLMNCKLINEVFPIKRKFSDMRAIMKKVHEISKNSPVLSPEGKKINRTSKFSVLSQPPVNQSPYIVHKFIKSKRLMVTSSFSRTQKKKQNINPLERQKRLSGGQRTSNKQDLSQIEKICKVANKLKSYFQKNAAIYDKLSAFQSPDVSLFYRKGMSRNRWNAALDYKQNTQ